MVIKKKLWFGMIIMLVMSFTAAHADQIGKKVEQPVQEALKTRQKTQKEDEAWRQKKEQLILELEHLQSAVKRLQEQKDELIALTTATTKRVEAKTRQLESIKSIERDMEPFLRWLVEEVKKLPETGLPFLITERAERIQRLEALMDDPDITLSEKFRKAMEALQVEMEYGLTIETYQEQITMEGDMFLVNVFRLGRLGLFFQSLDHMTSGIYDPLTEQWSLLPDAYNRSLQKAIEIAAKRRPAELIRMPLGRMVQQ